MKFGTVAIVGRPNVGKSTLLNGLLGEKIAIVSDKPQTTRTRILGLLHLPEAQVVLLDTPGLHDPQHLLNKRMVRTAVETVREADLVYMMVDATSRSWSVDRPVVEQVGRVLAQDPKPAFLLINKVDLVSKPRVLPLIEAYSQMWEWAEIVPLSAKTMVNVDRLLDLTKKQLRDSQALYAEDMLTDQSMRTLAAELIREKILHHTRQELPHSVAVAIEHFLEDGRLARIAATIFVEKETQKPIVIGKRGERLKAVGTAARLEMERLFHKKVALDLWVKVRSGWREDGQMLAELGY